MMSNWTTILAFLRVSTHTRAFVRPLGTDAAAAAVTAWLERPCVGIADPGERYWEILLRLLAREVLW